MEHVLSQQKRGIYNKCVCDSDLQRDRMGYTDLEQKVPAAVFFCGPLTVVVAALLGLQGNSYISSGLDLMFISKGWCRQDIRCPAVSTRIATARFNAVPTTVPPLVRLYTHGVGTAASMRDSLKHTPSTVCIG